MFEPQTYIDRRRTLKEKFDSGLLLFLGNNESPSNYQANTYAFRQDSNFLYYFGIDLPGMAALIDVDTNTSVLYGTEYSIDDIVWMGPQPGLIELAEMNGIDRSESFNNLQTLDCSSNLLSQLNVSGLVNLQKLICSTNKLTSLNVDNLQTGTFPFS